MDLFLVLFSSNMVFGSKVGIESAFETEEGDEKSKENQSNNLVGKELLMLHFNSLFHLQWLSIENQQGCDNSDISFILTIFPKNFWNKWYLIWKP